MITLWKIKTSIECFQMCDDNGLDGWGLFWLIFGLEAKCCLEMSSLINAPYMLFVPLSVITRERGVAAPIL